MNKINALLDESLDYIWNMIYGKNRKKNEINNIDIDKDKDIDEYVSKYMDIVNDKSELVNKIGELIDGIMIDIDRETDNNIIVKKLKKLKDNILKLISVNVYTNPDTKEKHTNPDTKKKHTNPDTKKKHTNPDTKKKHTNPDIKPDIQKHRCESPSKTFNTDKIARTFEYIKTILKNFLCEKFMNKEFNGNLITGFGMIVLHSKELNGANGVAISKNKIFLKKERKKQKEKQRKNRKKNKEYETG